MNTKVRFVRCPQCRQVLPEVAELPVYKCGGCGTVLQAKNRKNDTKETEPCKRETYPTQKNDPEHVHEDKKDSSVNQESTIPSTKESAFVKSSEGDQDEFSDCRTEQLAGLSNFYEIPSSIELSCPGNEDSSPEARAHMEPDDDLHPLDQYKIRDQNEFEGYTGERPGDFNTSKLNHLENESYSPLAAGPKEDDERTGPLEKNNGVGENEFGGCRTEWPRNMELSKEAYSSSSELTCNETEELSQAAGSDTEMAENLKSCFIFRSSSPENLLDSRLKDSSISAHRSVVEHGLSENLKSPSMEQMKQGQNGVSPCFERISSVDTLENVPLINSGSKLGVARGEMYKSPTARSYYAYYGGESSCSEIDHKIPSRHFHFSRRNFKDTEFIGTKKLPRRELSDKYFSRGYSRGSQAGPSNFGHNELQYRSRHHSPDKREYREPDKVELLRMVYELQDQLNRTRISKETINGRISSRVAKKEKQFSSYHDDLAQEREMYDRRYNRRKVCSPQCNFLRMDFSGEAIHRRHQIDCLCLQCCPREWHCSAQLPPRGICFNKGYYMAHPSHNRGDPYRSRPSSPRQHRGSEFSWWNRGTKSDDLRHKDFDFELKRPNLRDKHQPMKRHFRPIAGGSPIIACYRCFELMQVPADFLLFRRRCHRLRCSSCSEVLNFLLENRIHVVRYIPDAIAPPPSEVDDYADASKKRNLAPNAGAVSCSEDYDQSFCKSGSTVGGPLSLTLRNALERNSNNGKMSFGSSFEPMEEKKKKKKKKSVILESENKYKNNGERFDYGGPSTKMSKWERSSSEIEEITLGRSSPLHRRGKVINR